MTTIELVQMLKGGNASAFESAVALDKWLNEQFDSTGRFNPKPVDARCMTGHTIATDPETGRVGCPCGLYTLRDGGLVKDGAE